MREEFRTLIGGIESETGPKLPDVEDVPPPFYGRVQELTSLRSALEVACAQSTCRSVTVVGPAGIGKSRLIEEFLRGVRSLEDPCVRVLHAKAAAGSKWSTFNEIFTQRFGLTDEMGSDERKAEVRAQVAKVFDDRKVGDVLFFLGELLDLDFQASPLTKAVEEAPESLVRRAVVKSFFEADAAYGPMCLVFDDLHACHEDTVALLEFLADSVKAPILFVFGARPELLARPGGWPANPRRWIVQLDSLGEVEASALAGSLLSAGGMTPMHLVDQAREVAGGNPGRIHQTARRYRDSGSLQLAPAGAEEALSARIDALGPADRILLQRAALVGGVFWLGALVVFERIARDTPDLWNDKTDDDRRQLSDRLQRLAERDYVMRLPDSTFTGDVEFVFKHRPERDRLAALTSPTDAREWHRIIADWLDGQAEVRAHEEYLEMLADHREKAGASALAANIFIEAALRARARDAAKVELRNHEKALSLLGPDGSAARLSSLLRAGEILESMQKPQPALQRYREALGLAFRLDRRPMAVFAHLAISRVQRAQGRDDEARRHVAGARSLLDSVPEAPWVTSARAVVAEFSPEPGRVAPRASERAVTPPPPRRVGGASG